MSSDNKLMFEFMPDLYVKCVFFPFIYVYHPVEGGCNVVPISSLIFILIFHFAME